MRLYVYRGKLILAAMYCRRVGNKGRTYAAAANFVVKHDNAVEVQIVISAVFAAATETVLVAHHLPILDAHKVTAQGDGG
jgi:hypothetical protein